MKLEECLYYEEENPDISVYCGDCLEIMKILPDNFIDAVVTDPPYGLEFMSKEWDRFRGKFNKKEDNFKGMVLPSQETRNIKCSECGKWLYDHPPRNCMCGGIRREQMKCFQNFTYNWATEVLRVLKPGGHLLSFGGSRTYHRMVCAIEDAGFEVRDMIEWIYGSGFPKSLNIGKAVDKLQGNEREEYLVPIAKPDSDCWGIPNNNSDGSYSESSYNTNAQKVNMGSGMRKHTKGNSEWEGWGTALKPSHEPICMARKPLSEKTVAENVLKWGVGGINIDGCRVGTNENLNGGAYSKGEYDTDGKVFELGLKRQEGKYQQPQGRFPANLIHDGSNEVMGLFPQTKSGSGIKNPKTSNVYGGNSLLRSKTMGDGKYLDGDSGSAARFFYCAKASKSERDRGLDSLSPAKENLQGLDTRGRTLVREDGSKTLVERWQPDKGRVNNHPTVKPIKLMEYLVKLITPPNGIVLDMFMGSGSTGVACKNLNKKFIGIELNKDYVDIAKRRISQTMRILI